MAHTPAGHSVPGNNAFLIGANETVYRRSRSRYRRSAFLAAVVLLSPLIFAQSNPQVTGVDPPSGKVNDSVTVTGTNLEKSSVAAVFLSNDNDDFKATVTDQTAEKIVIKIPQVKSGVYRISVLVGDKILIKPVRFTVE
jgi:translation initiation factor IF-2